MPSGRNSFRAKRSRRHHGRWNSDLTIRALRRRSLVATIFEAFGMKAKVSEAGRIASRLIQQMGGVQGCRVFKIAGVRALIEKYKPFQSFTRGDATQIIGEVDPVTHVPNFARYERLFIEPREGPKLKPHHVFDYMVRKNVFRVGLRFTCPNCELEFWTSLDDIGTEITCEYCGQRFNVTSHLKDGAWAYRRSGLFGREDHQQGAIPVAVTLQQLDMVLSSDTMFVTSMTIESTAGAFGKCETDLVIVSERGFYDDRLGIAVASPMHSRRIELRRSLFSPRLRLSPRRKSLDAARRNRLDARG